MDWWCFIIIHIFGHQHDKKKYKKEKDRQKENKRLKNSINVSNIKNREGTRQRNLSEKANTMST